MIAYEYGFFNDTKQDREYYRRIYKQRGFKRVKVKRVRTDTKGLKMYEITMER
jgi:L-alanine-DL-glutamate epimerase-like enolase superfamily enzyme